MAINKDPDASVIPVFREHAERNEAKSAAAGRPIFDDVDIVELRYPGRRDYSVHPATAFSHWTVDPLTGEQIKVTYAERFQRQYQQFKSRNTQTKSGTPLDYATFLTEGMRASLKALNVYTIEMLAAVDGADLKNLGPGGRDMKNRAMAYLEDSDQRSGDTKMIAELEALRARNAAMEEDLQKLKAVVGEAEFEDMDLDELREYIRSVTGHAPVGSLNRKSLVKLAVSAKKGVEKDEAA
jgi:hypothetical protein